MKEHSVTVPLFCFLFSMMNMCSNSYSPNIYIFSGVQPRVALLLGGILTSVFKQWFEANPSTEDQNATRCSGSCFHICTRVQTMSCCTPGLSSEHQQSSWESMQKPHVVWAPLLQCTILSTPQQSEGNPGFIPKRFTRSDMHISSFVLTWKSHKNQMIKSAFPLNSV